MGFGFEFGLGLVLDLDWDCDWILFYEKYVLGDHFLRFLGLLVTFLCNFVSQERLSTCSVSWGRLGGSRCSKQGHGSMPLVAFGLHFGSLF